MELGTPVELEMPLEVFWKLETLVKEISYTLSSQENPAEISVQAKKIYKFCTPYVISEKNRIWMLEKINEDVG